MKAKRPLTHLWFLLPNLLGFATFTLFPVVLCFFMVFTNWSLKPALPLDFVGIRNFVDVLGLRALATPKPALLWSYVLAALSLLGGVVGLLWAAMAWWKGVKLGGLLFALLGVACMALPLMGHGGQGIFLGGGVALVCALLLLVSDEEGGWQPGLGIVPGLLAVLGAVALAKLDDAMWQAYIPRDVRFWEYFYNTVYFMLGIPFQIIGSLALALLLYEDFPVFGRKSHLIGASLCLACGVLTYFLLKGMGYPNTAVLGAIFWAMATLGLGFGVVAFRTIFYLPTFTSGVALMILWKALYNPQTGPINVALASMLHVPLDTLPQWLTSIAWAKPALVVMGIWTGIGGTGMLLYLAALSEVPQDVIEAAHMDGAGPWARFRHVTLPFLAPTTFFISMMSIIGGLQGGFEQAKIMTNGTYGTTTLSYYIYNKAFLDLDLGYAAAVSWVLFACIFVATALNWKFGKEAGE